MPPVAIAARARSAQVSQRPPLTRTSRPAIFADYAQRDLPTLLDAARRVPPTNPVVIGTYGINKDDALAVRSLPNGRYAPVFVLVRRKMPRLFEGIPEVKDLRTWAQAFSAGQEIGRRMRDRIESAKAAGVPIDAWQLDELWPSFTDNDNPPRDQIGREYIRGVVDGISQGRDGKLMQGYLYVAKFNKLAQLGNSGEMKRLWTTLDRACLGLLGEEYPPFSATPAERARPHARAVDLLAGYGPHGKALAARYIPLLTPGLRESNALGGRRPGQSTAEAQAWQDRYTDVRVSQGIAGIGFFNFSRNDADLGNADPRVVRTLAEDVRRTLQALNATR